MTNLQSLIEAVREQSLDRQTLEKYRDEMLQFFNLLHLECAELEKKEALFMNDMTDESVARRKIMWKSSKEGQRLIEIKHYILSVNKLLDSLKNRIYSFI